MDSNPLSLRDLLTTLGQRLEQLSGPELQQALLTHAANLPAAERQDFLDLFPLSDRVPEGRLPVASISPAVWDLTWPVDSDPLLSDIDDLAERVESGYFFEGFGWDDEIHDQRSFGNESWADEMADYFHAAREAFTSGEIGLARAAQSRLFDTLGLGDEVRIFAGQGPAVVMLDVDRHEATCQYLRAVYETRAPGERAGELASNGTGSRCPARSRSCRMFATARPRICPISVFSCPCGCNNYPRQTEANSWSAGSCSKPPLSPAT